MILLIMGCEIEPNGKENATEETRMNPIKISSQATPITNNILATDYSVAKKFLNKALVEKDLETIRLGLKGFSFQIRIDVVEAIERLKDPRFLPDLATTLEDNQGCFSGGSETDSLQRDLDQQLISAIRQLTNMKLESYESTREQSCVNEKYQDSIRKIVKETRDWFKQHPPQSPFQNVSD